MKLSSLIWHGELASLELIDGTRSLCLSYRRNGRSFEELRQPQPRPHLDVNRW